MSGPHEPARIGRSLLLFEKFRLGGGMGLGLRREDDQKNASIPILLHPLRIRAFLNATIKLPHPEAANHRLKERATLLRQPLPPPRRPQSLWQPRLRRRPLVLAG